MKWIARVMTVAAVVALMFGPALAADATTLNGKFEWVRDDGTNEGDLKAIFTPAGDGRWKVDFHFDWEDGPHVYSGTAEGSMDGDLHGTVNNDNKEREGTFKFKGSFAEGVFSGSHGYMDGDTLNDTGTMTLRAGK